MSDFDGAHCVERIGIGQRCGAAVVVGLRVCLDHASKDALALALAQWQELYGLSITPPTLDEATACAVLMQAAAATVRAGHPELGRRAKEAVDAFKTIGGKARADALAAAEARGWRAGAEAMREACAAGCLAVAARNDGADVLDDSAEDEAAGATRGARACAMRCRTLPLPEAPRRAPGETT